MKDARVPVSRPLRAFTIVIGGWIMMRGAFLWHGSIVVAGPLAKGVALIAQASAATASVTILLEEPIKTPFATIGKPVSTVRVTTSTDDDGLPERGAVTASLARPVLDPDTQPSPAMVPLSLPPPTNRATRFSGSAWALYRPDSAGASLGSGGTLGGSQAGARIYYEPGPRGIALTARISAPLAARYGREASVGVGLRGRAVGILLERRVALDRGGRTAMSVTAYGGVYDVVLPAHFKMGGYVQFGIVGARSRDRFVDGAVRVLHPLSEAGGVKLSVGAAVSGGAQPGVSRVDAGPELIADIPASARTVRITAGWRQRMAGTAAPRSGPSLTMGFDF